MRLRRLLSMGLSLGLAVAASAQPQARFHAYTLAGKASEVLFCDLDGDGLKDLVLVDGMSLSIFYQDPGQGFPREPQSTYHFDPRPCLIWPARLGGPNESVLVLTTDGVTELDFTDRTRPPSAQLLIRQATIVPAQASVTNALCFPICVQSGARAAKPGDAEWPLLLLPTPEGLQVWQHSRAWHPVQLLAHALEARLWPSLHNPGYTTFCELELSIGDLNGDGREDLVVRRNPLGQTNLYSLYLQQTNGLFTAEPSLTYAEKVTPFSWRCWADLNHDGRPDLIKSLWLNEPSFLPSVPSGKVLVGTYLADERGHIPPNPHQVFRKSDWLAALPVVDIDGDGYLDLVLGYGHMDSREGVRKQVTARQLDYSLRFFFYRPGVGFPAEADAQRSVEIRLDHAEFPLDWRLPQSFQRRVKLGGDFTGQGQAALLVRDRSESISAYFFISREKGFSSTPNLQFSCPEPIEEWQVADLNHDGISDLIVTLEDQAGYRVFLSQK